MLDTEILLVNSYAPRQRVASDTALENSLAILRTYLEGKGISAEIIDDQRIFSLENGIPYWCRRLLKIVTGLQLRFYKNKIVCGMLLLAAWPLHAFALHRRSRYMYGSIQRIVDRLKVRRIPFFGIKLWYGDAYSWSSDLAAAVRRQCPETIIVVGGPQVKVYGESVLDDTDFDLAVMGQGEEILEKLINLYRQYPVRKAFFDRVQAVYGGRLIATGGFSGDKSAVVRQLAAQTIPIYRDTDLEGKILFHTIVDGVGCSWNKCHFCSHTRCSVPFTLRPVEDIIDEIETMLRRGIAFFRFSSSETTLGHGKKIAEAILDRGLNIRFSMFVRAVNPSEETLAAYQLMIKAGLRAVFMGGETGHDGVNREIMNKGVTRKDIINTIATIRLASDATGMPCRVGLSLIYPCPLPAGTSMDEVFKANTALIDETLPDTVIVNPPAPCPSTRWFDNADQFGFQFAQGARSFIRQVMRYEYSIYKPIELWPDLGAMLQGRNVKSLLKETGRLRAYAAGIGIPTDISDEYLMMTEAIGLCSRMDLQKFKRDTLLDIISGSAGYTRELAAAINTASRQLAAANTQAMGRCYVVPKEHNHAGANIEAVRRSFAATNTN